MTPISWPLAQADITSKFEWGRIQSPTDWIIPIAIFVAILLFVWRMYRRDAAELPGWLGWLLTFLRVVAFLGLLVLYLQPQWRSEREIVHNSRAAVVIDTSMSMNRTDSDAGGSSATRLQQIAAALDDTDFLARLRQRHDVDIYQFNNALDRDRLVVLNHFVVPASAGGAGTEPPEGGTTKPPPWRKQLEPRGTETRLGEALRQVLHDERNVPLAGVVVFSDGGQNAGAPPETAVELAREMRLPIFTVGIGSEQKPINVKVYEFKVPPRAYPGDRYVVNGQIQGQGMAGRTVLVELLARDDEAARDPAQRGTGERIDSQPVTLLGDGELVPVKFELTPKKVGRRALCLRVEAPKGDANPHDNFMEGEVEVVDHKNKVLLMAGGPNRDYQYLRTLLFRDRSTTVHALLQTGATGVSQEAHEILDEFPTDRKKMYEYDCVVAFDPNWLALKPEQIDLLESWVGDQCGGLIVSAGPVYAGRTMLGENWVQDSAANKIRVLYPVEFFRQSSLRTGSAYTAKEPWPLEFTREGIEAEFLWLGDTVSASQQAWATFPGIFSFFPVRGPKPGATVLARFGDPRTAQGGKQPVYFAEQFYGGGGRVFYMGSAEMWRLRRVDPTYFDQFYTKLIRHVSQGRFLRQSTRGGLQVGSDRYMVGNSVEVRAQLTNVRHEPLVQPSVSLHVSRNGVVERSLTLQADPSRPGTYVGQFPVLKDGEYRLELPVPESRDERLERTFSVLVPKLEEENPQRNAALLSEIAGKTPGGKYFASLTSALRGSGPDSLVGRLTDHKRTETVPVAADPQQEEEWLRWMMIGLCTLLCGEWLIRRLVKLA